ncbi:uncharacterized protein STEHIDRAFT_154605 [Stereum hirsutum FP-91666 SS1]|uniref:uncharacterized protein n=1 Tax=Stereum hirsutum (strain FP-91666) TaxID=721885 RepID=UPI000440DFE3|nr:uncharacterized protein STEHIDRAFT_154605 [Stereum hirsutum FP-91666 SS1]EIM88890.1 hypothetical protein STEHIDRAFT_154605 [Stereum hirsutum FP-91666 SS1]
MAKARRQKGPNKPHTPIQQTNSPVTRLPLEVLSLIFLYHRHPESPGKDYTWLQILHVCRQWRMAAIGCAHMWTNITTKKRLLRFFMLKQSKGLPIVLKGIKFVKNESPEAKNILERNLHRIQSLGIVFDQCSEKEVTRCLEKVLGPDAGPVLRSLEVATGMGYSITVQVPDVTLSLSSLSVDYLCLEFPEGRIQKNLTSFRVSLPWLANNHIQRRAYLRKTLPKMPNLTYLHIADDAWVSSYWPDPVEQTIELPQLEKLRCSGTVFDCVLALELLHLPPTARVDLRIRDRRDAVADRLYTALSHFFGRRESVRSETVATSYDVHYATKFISDHEWDVAHRVLFFDSGPNSHSNPHPRSPMPSTSEYPHPQHLPILLLQYRHHRVAARDSRSCYAEPDYLSQILSILNVPLRSVISLRLQSNLPYNVDTANNFDSTGALLSKLHFLTNPGVKSLYIGDLGTAECFLPFLSLPNKSASSSDATSRSTSTTTSCSPSKEFMVFPNLETLVFGDLSPSALRYSQCVTDKEAADQRIRGVMQKLESAMEDRARGGRRLKKLGIRADMYETCMELVNRARDMGWVEDILYPGADLKNGELGMNLLDGIGSDDEDN